MAEDFRVAKDTDEQATNPETQSIEDRRRIFDSKNVGSPITIVVEGVRMEGGTVTRICKPTIKSGGLCICYEENEKLGSVEDGTSDEDSCRRISFTYTKQTLRSGRVRIDDKGIGTSYSLQSIEYLA